MTWWWWKQSAANPSPHQNPCYAGKIQGNFAIQADFWPARANYLTENSPFFLQIPYSTEQGIFPAEQGIAGKHQGIGVLRMDTNFCALQQLCIPYLDALVETFTVFCGNVSMGGWHGAIGL